jgi:hypothetical protein
LNLIFNLKLSQRTVNNLRTVSRLTASRHRHLRMVNNLLTASRPLRMVSRRMVSNLLTASRHLRMVSQRMVNNLLTASRHLLMDNLYMLSQCKCRNLTRITNT